MAPESVISLPGSFKEKENQNEKKKIERVKGQQTREVKDFNFNFGNDHRKEFHVRIGEGTSYEIAIGKSRSNRMCSSKQERRDLHHSK